MKIFVLGASATGKTPMATALAAALGLAHVRASAWVRERFPGRAAGADAGSRQAFVEAITAFATRRLVDDPWVSAVALRDAVAASGPCVIEGIRNPLDFVHLYDPRRDVTVWLEHLASELSPTAFERGLDVIASYLDWQAAAGLADAGPTRRMRYRFRHFRSDEAGAHRGATLDDAIADAIARLRPEVERAIACQPPAVAPVPTPARVHAEIPPVRTHVRAEYLYGMDPDRVGQVVACTAFAVSSYPGEAPTFQVLLPDGAVFSYIPPSALIDPERRRTASLLELGLDELVYFDCPDEQVCVHAHAALAGRVQAYFKGRDLWLGGDYLFTIDWWTGNHLAHAVALDNGQFAVLPHHKLKFGDHGHTAFEPYKKQRKIWRVGPGHG
ncbi:MAG: hypothetical protein R3B06_23395 [Kofleriaceae bacterium]